MSKRRREKRSQQIDPFTAFAVNAVNMPAAASVSARLAENLSAVLACVQVISSAISTLPMYVYRDTGAGREIDERHPLQRMVRNGPNDRQTWPDFIEWLMASTLLRGNGLAHVVTDGAGQVAQLSPYPWDTVNFQILPSGRLVYDVTEINAIYGGTGRMRRLLQDEVLHLRCRTDDGLIGRSPLQRSGPVVSTALSTQEFAGKAIANGLWPSGTIEFPTEAKLNPEKVTAIKNELREKLSGAKNAGSFMVLQDGAKWNTASISLEDAELLSTRQFSTEELARLYNVPPVMIGDLSNSSFNNTETLGRHFAIHTLRPWTTKLQAQLARAVFTLEELQTHSIEFDMAELMRGDPVARWNANKIAVDSRILTVNEVREIEGWNPRSDGNDLKPRQDGAVIPTPTGEAA